MSSKRAYAVVGHGRWGTVIGSILHNMGKRTVAVAGSRPIPGEPPRQYRDRITTALGASGAHIAWICVPPGPQVAAVVAAALDLRMHVVAEKPWLVDPAETHRLVQSATEQGCTLGVHYQYCFLDSLRALRDRPDRAHDTRFSGAFVISRPNRLGVPAMHNLGSHLVAIHRNACPDAHLQELVVGYEGTDLRRVVVAGGEGSPALEHVVDFTTNAEPLIQRFVSFFEEAVATGSAFALDPLFALAVSAQCEALAAHSVLRDVSPQGTSCS